MTDDPTHAATRVPRPPATEMELQLHASVESLQVEVRALAAAIDNLCRAVEAVTVDAPPSPELTSALEDARQSLGRIW